MTTFVSLTACNDGEYREFCARQIVEYADQLARAGEVAAQLSLAAAQERLRDLSADRLRSLGHEFLVARSVQDAAVVGWAWLSPGQPFLGPGHERSCWLSQLTVDEAHRRRGWGTAIMDAVGRHATNLGFAAIWLRVFDWNVAAQRLYQSRGYELARKFPTDAHLFKRL